MKKILVFAGSNSLNSINKKFAVFAAGKLNDVTLEIVDLNNFQLPTFGIDLELSQGIPDNAMLFLEKIKSSQGIVLSLAEHNGSYTSVFKNLMDWMSRIDGKLWSNIPMLLLATSPGGRGGSSVMSAAKERFQYMGGNVVANFSFPFFEENFSKLGLKDDVLSSQFQEAINTFNSKL